MAAAAEPGECEVDSLAACKLTWRSFQHGSEPTALLVAEEVLLTASAPWSVAKPLSSGSCHWPSPSFARPRAPAAALPKKSLEEARGATLGARRRQAQEVMSGRERGRDKVRPL